MRIQTRRRPLAHDAAHGSCKSSPLGRSRRRSAFARNAFLYSLRYRLRGDLGLIRGGEATNPRTARREALVAQRAHNLEGASEVVGGQIQDQLEQRCIVKIDTCSGSGNGGLFEGSG
jgi:hypothetical protein